MLQEASADRTGWASASLTLSDVLVTARYVRTGDRLERVMLGLRDAEARQRAERDQATVLSTVAHELRAPLTSVTGFTSSLLRRWDRFTDEQKRLMIETIEADAARLTRLITELLDISRLDSHSLNLRLGNQMVTANRASSTLPEQIECLRIVRQVIGPLRTQRERRQPGLSGAPDDHETIS